MRIEILRKGENMIEFHLIGEDHTFANLLVESLHKNKHVKFAAYSIDHPILMARRPRIRVVTDGKVKPVKALEEAAQSIFDMSRDALEAWTSEVELEKKE